METFHFFGSIIPVPSLPVSPHPIPLPELTSQVNGRAVRRGEGTKQVLVMVGFMGRRVGRAERGPRGEYGVFIRVC